MSELSDLHAEGVTDLHSYFVGKRDEQQRIIKLLEDEMERLEGWTDYPAVNALMNIRGALIKGEK